MNGWKEGHSVRLFCIVADANVRSKSDMDAQSSLIRYS